MYGDLLNYDGTKKHAEISHNVSLIDKETTLTTQFLDYDLENSIGYYANHGKIINGENTLTSKQGHYYPNLEMYFFKDSVVITNPDYTIYSDTIKYHTVSKTAYF
ncbi:MAG: hypothetical protein HC896_02790 [Bacteroidales bacterium]|nr:hypothetical protein [Bacteroidales bacterium]